MSFQDLLNQPLPSATKVEESVDNELDADTLLQQIEESVATGDENELDADTLLQQIEESVATGDENETPVENSAEDDEEPVEENADDEDNSDIEALLENIVEACSSCTEDGEGEETEPETVEDTDEEITVEPDEGDDNEDDEDFDVDDLSDEELAALDAELTDDTIDEIEDEEEEEELTPEEEIEADDMMKVAATTMLVNDELNAEEKVALLTNEAELASIINEGFMTEADINELSNEVGLVTEAKYTNKMIIRLDAASKKKQLYALAVNVSAAAHNDRDYQKLKKVMKMRKILRARLNKKYKTEATKRMKIYFKRLKNSRSNTLSSIAKKHDKQ